MEGGREGDQGDGEEDRRRVYVDPVTVMEASDEYCLSRYGVARVERSARMNSQALFWTGPQIRVSDLAN